MTKGATGEPVFLYRKFQKKSRGFEAFCLRAFYAGEMLSLCEVLKCSFRFKNQKKISKYQKKTNRGPFTLLCIFTTTRKLGFEQDLNTCTPAFQARTCSTPRNYPLRQVGTGNLSDPFHQLIKGYSLFYVTEIYNSSLNSV